MQKSYSRIRDVKKVNTSGTRRNKVSWLSEDPGYVDCVKGFVFILRSHLRVLS